MIEVSIALSFRLKTSKSGLKDGRGFPWDLGINCAVLRRISLFQRSSLFE